MLGEVDRAAEVLDHRGGVEHGGFPNIGAHDAIDIGDPEPGIIESQPGKVRPLFDLEARGSRKPAFVPVLGNTDDCGRSLQSHG